MIVQMYKQLNYYSHTYDEQSLKTLYTIVTMTSVTQKLITDTEVLNDTCMRIRICTMYCIYNICLCDHLVSYMYL